MKKTIFLISAICISLLLIGCLNKEEIQHKNPQIEIIDQKILITMDEDVSSFLIFVDDEQVGTTSKKTFDLSDINELESGMNYKIHVGVYFQGILYESNKETVFFIRDDGDVPFIEHSNDIIYQHSDLIIHVYEGSYIEVSFSANNLTSEDYKYEDSTLTLKASYVDKFIEQYPNQSYLIVLATFTDEQSNNYYISIFINLKS